MPGPRGRLYLTGQEPDDGGLSRAVRAEETIEFPLFDGKFNARHRNDLAVFFSQVPGLNDIFGYFRIHFRTSPANAGSFRKKRINLII